MPKPEAKIQDILVEACIDSVASALAAQAAGARRLELCASLNDAGVTPSAGMITAVLAQVNIPTFVIIRARGGGFVYSQQELDVMLRDIDAARGLGVQGIVIGALTENGQINVPQVRALAERASGLPVTFHRAFDLTRDPAQALDTLISLDITRVLTSGGGQTALNGAGQIARYVNQAAGRITVMAGGGINEGNVQEIVRRSGVREVHARCSRQTVGTARSTNPSLRLRKPLPDLEIAWEETDERRMRALVERLS